MQPVRRSTARRVLGVQIVGEGATELHLVHRGIEGRDMLIGVFAGWHGHFDILAEVLVGPRKTDFWLRDQELEKEYEARV